MDQKDPEDNLGEKKFVEFMHDLEKALQNGKLNDSINQTNKSWSFSSQASIDNLSNQTFMYIVNWLKSHQLKIDEKNLVSQDYEETTQMLDYIDEVKFLRNKLKQNEFEKETLVKRINELQDENVELKARLGQMDNGNEVDRLRITINELSKLNEEKDRKVDELTKQVIRFKRIQEIVLSAQSGNYSNISSNILSYSKNHKNYDEIDFDTINENGSRLDGDKEEAKDRVQNSITDTGDKSKNCLNDQIINSGSMSSSISSTSSSTNSIGAQNQSQVMAPLATISELTNYSTSTLLVTPKSEEKSNCSPKNKNNQKSAKYSSAITLSQTKSFSPSPKSSNQHKSLRQFFGKLIRTSLVNINDSNNFSNSLDKNSNFKRGGFRSTANARLQSNPNLDTLTFSKWSTSQVCEYLHKNGFESYFSPINSEFSHKWIKNGLHLLQASQYDYEKELGIKNPLHRKKLSLLIQSIINSSHLGPESKNLVQLDQYWVLKWLDDIGLPQYKDIFGDNLFDGRMLMHINNEDFQHLSINSELHFLSIKRAIHVLRLNNFDPQCLRRRPSGDEALDKSEVMLWTNHRVMEWLRTIDLSEYAPNLRGSGVHGGLMVFEARFNSTVLADILSIPSSKTLLRRHLTTLFNDLIGAQMLELKKKAECQVGYQQLTAFSKVKHVKKANMPMASLFSSTHKRTKSQDSREFLTLSPFIELNGEQKKDKGNCVGQSATLPSNTSAYCEESLSSFKNKLSLIAQENLPTSIV